jgi:hypothetical protein
MTAPNRLSPGESHAKAQQSQASAIQQYPSLALQACGVSDFSQPALAGGIARESATTAGEGD